MSERVKIVIEVSDGEVVGVYAPNAEFVIIDYDHIKDLGRPHPTAFDFYEAEPHSDLCQKARELLFP